MAKKSTSPWVWVGCGCGLLLVLGILAAVGAGVYSFSWAKKAVEDMADPEARAQRALEMLGASELPPGYSTRTVLQIPFAFGVVILGDDPLPIFDYDPEADLAVKAESFENMVVDPDDVENHLFFYLDSDEAKGDENVARVLSGRDRLGLGNMDFGLDFDTVADLDSGELQIAERRVRWRAVHGWFDGIHGKKREAVWAEIFFDCSESTRLALWLERLPEGVAPSDAGPNDPERLEEFLNYFAPCTVE
ncbi:MAG: hypothetical protein AAGN46_10010 [Acidobacteriota bacterium]